MTPQTLAKPISPEAYLAQEEQASDRHEYIQGVIKPMAGGTPTHHKLAFNTAITLKIALKKQAYEIFHADQRLWIPSQQIYTYPDVMVTGKPLVLQEGRKDTVLNACLIAEVLSPATKNYDRSEKFHYYRSIPEFQDYLLIEPEWLFVEHYHRQGPKQWSLTEYTAIDEVIHLVSIDCDLALADIYEDIEL
ncbi:Uma2 family endonuclease [Picosynechococcus sp. NKBG042902]|uniref:Uma2 family endonuclease n=1 Tax=Picosynechococcus sp. NKBG042902 TaxID=490193 RepID=UPI0004AA619D|nr:Uma2 family endonuclease [Picosynechococcus sp. NKBG042902]